MILILGGEFCEKKSLWRVFQGDAMKGVVILKNMEEDLIEEETNKSFMNYQIKYKL